LQWNGKEWGQAENLGGELNSSPAAVARGPYRIDVVARGKGGNIWHAYWNYGSDWSAWYCPNNQLVISNPETSAPSLCSWAPERLDVFATSDSHRLRHMYWDASANAWSSWEDLGGDLTSSPAAVSWGLIASTWLPLARITIFGINIGDDHGIGILWSGMHPFVQRWPCIPVP